MISMNSIFNHVGNAGSNSKLDEMKPLGKEPWVQSDCENQNKKAYYNYYGTWKNGNLAMPWAMIVISFVQVFPRSYVNRNTSQPSLECVRYS